MIDFSPLHETLKEKGMVISAMRDIVLNSKTIAKINRNEVERKFMLSTVEEICLFLDVPIEKVIRILPNDCKNK